MDMETEKFLKSLGLSWITIAEAMSDENQAKTVQLVKGNPKITKEEFLAKMQITED